MTKQEIEGLYKAAVREHDTFESRRKDRGLANAYAGSTHEKLIDWVGKLKAGHAEVADADVASWVSDLERRAADVALMKDVGELLEREAEIDGGTVRFDTALRGCKREYPDALDRVIKNWDGAKKLIGYYRDPRFAAVPEVQELVKQYDELEPTMTNELPVKLAGKKVERIIKDADYPIRRLESAIDDRDERNALAARKDLREKLRPLAAWAQHPDAKAFLERCDKAFAASEKALGDKIVIPEIQAAEKVIGPLLDRVERAVARKSERAVLDHAPRLHARKDVLAPLVKHQRIALLQQRVDGAFARIAADLGADIAARVAAGQTVPQFAIDPTSDSRLQGALAELNRPLADYSEAYAAALATFEDDVDFMTGAYSSVAGSTGSDTSRQLIRYARQAEEKVKAVAAVDPAHPAVATMAELVPALIERAQKLQDDLATKLSYADAMASVERAMDRARRSRVQAIDYGTDGPFEYWPNTIRALAEVDSEADRAASILPDDHDEADTVKAKAAAMRAEAIDTMTRISVAEAAKYARNNQTDEAERYAQAMSETLPDSPANAQIQAIVAGSANARQRAEGEAAAAAEKIKKQALSFSQQMRSTYDSWASEKEPITALAGTIVRDIEELRGKWVRHTYDLLDLWLADREYKLDGDIYFLAFDADLKAQLRGGLEKLDGWYTQLATKAASTHDAPIPTTTQHYPKDADFVAEISGTAMYTPKHEVRDATGNLLAVIDGTPYPVPKLTVRAAWTAYCTVVPGETTSVDNIDPSNILD